jgi:hypothetical protein
MSVYYSDDLVTLRARCIQQGGTLRLGRHRRGRPAADGVGRMTPCHGCPFRNDCPNCQWQGGTDSREET